MTEIEWTDAERDAVVQALHEAYEWQYGQCDHGTYGGGHMHGQPYKMCAIQAGRILETLAPLVAAREAQAAAKALREAANRWQQGGWADDLPSKGAGRTEGIIGMAHRATAFLRDLADRLERGES